MLFPPEGANDKCPFPVKLSHWLLSRAVVGVGDPANTKICLLVNWPCAAFRRLPYKLKFFTGPLSVAPLIRFSASTRLLFPSCRLGRLPLAESSETPSAPSCSAMPLCLAAGLFCEQSPDG